MTVHSSRTYRFTTLTLCALLMVFTLLPAVPAAAQDACAPQAPSDGVIAASCHIELNSAVRRTKADMDRASEREALAPAAPVVQPEFRPAVSAREYARLKAAAGRAPAQDKLSASSDAALEAALAAANAAVTDVSADTVIDAAVAAAAADAVAADAAATDATTDAATDAAADAATDAASADAERLTPVTITPNFNGATQAGLFPPDTHGAIGLTQYVQVVNSQIRVFSRTGSQLSNRTLASFFGYTAQTIFDPRVVYDPVWNRWIVSAEARPESSTFQRHFLGISQTSSATGAFWIYSFDVEFGSNNFWDYPQLGFDQDSIIITANIFPPSGGPRAAMLTIAKARLYNGLGWSVPVYLGLQSTLAPPIVLDQNPNTYLIAAPPGGTRLTMYTLTNSSRINPTLSAAAFVTVPSYSVPPNAPQPGTTQVLDTLDARFVNASTQVGNFLWQVHTVALGSFAATKVYRINTVNRTQINSFFFATGTSHDFNVSIGANSTNDIFATWTVTDVPAGTRPQMRVAACANQSGASFTCSLATDDVAMFTSPASLTGNFQANFGSQRWGDYSAVTIDPLNRKRAWATNEIVPSSAFWGSRIGAMTIP